MDELLVSALARLRSRMDPIDEILRTFGAHNVAEISGRGRRFVFDKDGRASLKTRPTNSNQSEINAFQGDSKPIALITRAGSISLSLHAVEGLRPRVMLIMELPWSSEDFVQQIGRVNRVGQLSTPRYIHLTSNVAEIGRAHV